MIIHEQTREFALFGSRVRLRIGIASPGDAPEAERLALAIEIAMRRAHAALSRFDPGSELSRCNRDQRPRVPASPLLIAFAEAAIAAARRSGGLVDPTLVDAIERCGYRESRAGLPPASLRDAIVRAPPRRCAMPAPRRWEEISVDRGGRTITRPRGLRLDSGGIGKGLAADLAARSLERFGSYVVDCGGDMRIGGALGLPRPVEVADPFGGPVVARFELAEGAVATSGLATRLWRHAGGFAHHLIDPSTGEPAWTGVVQATAIAPTGVEAEMLAKAALLAGPQRGAELLREHGGVLVADDGSVETIAGARQAAYA